MLEIPLDRLAAGLGTDLLEGQVAGPHRWQGPVGCWPLTSHGQNPAQILGSKVKFLKKLWVAWAFPRLLGARRWSQCLPPSKNSLAAIANQSCFLRAEMHSLELCRSPGQQLNMQNLQTPVIWSSRPSRQHWSLFFRLHGLAALQGPTENTCHVLWWDLGPTRQSDWNLRRSWKCESLSWASGLTLQYDWKEELPLTTPYMAFLFPQDSVSRNVFVK